MSFAKVKNVVFKYFSCFDFFLISYSFLSTLITLCYILLVDPFLEACDIYIFFFSRSCIYMILRLINYKQTSYVFAAITFFAMIMLITYLDILCYSKGSQKNI